MAVTQFQIKVLEAIGLGIRSIAVASGSPDAVWFSVSHSGFFAAEPGADSIPVTVQTYELFLALKEQPFGLSSMAEDTNSELYSIVTQFITYQLEREIKSSTFLRAQA